MATVRAVITVLGAVTSMLGAETLALVEAISATEVLVKLHRGVTEQSY